MQQSRLDTYAGDGGLDADESARLHLEKGCLRPTKRAECLQRCGSLAQNWKRGKSLDSVEIKRGQTVQMEGLPFGRRAWDFFANIRKYEAILHVYSTFCANCDQYKSASIAKISATNFHPSCMGSPPAAPGTGILAFSSASTDSRDSRLFPTAILSYGWAMDRIKSRAMATSMSVERFK